MNNSENPNISLCLNLKQLSWNLLIDSLNNYSNIIFPPQLSNPSNLFNTLISIFTIILTYLHKLSISDIVLSKYIPLFLSCFQKINYSIHIFEYPISSSDSILNSRYSRIIYNHNQLEFTQILVSNSNSQFSSIDQLYSVYIYNNSIYKICFRII